MELFAMITLKQAIILLIIGIIAGMTSGLLGLGGAIIIIPLLVYWLGMHQHEAQGTSLMVLLFPVGIFAVLQYAKSGYVNIKFAILLIVGFLIGSYLGSKLAIQLPERILQKSFAVLLILVALKILTVK